MRSFKIILSLIFTLGLTFAFDTQLSIGDTQIPPLGKLLSPFHGFWQNAENEKISAPESLTIDGLREPVEVYFDDLLIPHIYAQNDHDLFLTQGYISAYHRLWQMEFQLYSTAGRISEILGEKALNYDREKRRSGLTMGAQQSLELMKKEDPEEFALIEAYTKGVNAYIDGLSFKDYPIEYKLLDYAPEKWTPFKCFLLLREMASQLSRDEMDLEHTNALKLWGRDIFEALYPERPAGIDPIIPKGTKWNFEPIQVTTPEGQYPLVATNGSISRPDPHYGSNNFVVNGKKTANGSVLLANEPDLGLNLPSIWYVMHLNSPNYNVMGSTIPGGPGIVLGFNDSIAWGFTNAKRDLVDWYKIEFKDKKREEYKYDNQWLKTKKVVEEFEIRGGSTFYDTIIYTHYGPVSYDSRFEHDEERVDLAMRWTAHDASKEPKALFLINKAKNYDDYVEAYSYFAGPPQNMIYGSTVGDIALWVNGKFPVKWEEQGKFVLDGSNSLHEWQAYMPREHLYSVKNPKQNFISSANQHPGDSTYPYYSYDYNYEYYRNRRINDRLNIMNDIKPQDFMKLQNDNFNYMASESLPMMLDSLGSTSLNPSQREMYDLLSAWDYFNEPELKEPSLYELWWDILYKNIWDEFENQNVSLYRPSYYNTISLLATQPNFEFFDDKTTSKKEDAGDLFKLSFIEAFDSLEIWKEKNGEDYSWYKFKNTTVLHLTRIGAFSRSEVKIGGNHNIVNAASGRAGPSWRMVVELSDGGVQAWGIYPGSQTGNPGNPTYSEFIDRWADGKYEPMLFQGDLKANDRIIFTQSLNPVE